jgi:hypothetical protein
MRTDVYTQQQVFRTAFPYLDGTAERYGSEHGVNQVCPGCKAGSNTQTRCIVARVVDTVDLLPWAEFYKTKQYAAYKCGACGYQWSWYRDGSDSGAATLIKE